MHVFFSGNTTFKIANFREGLIRRLVDEGHQVTVCAPPDEYVGKIREMGCAYLPLKMNRNGTAPLEELKLLLTVYRGLRQSHPDIVFGFTIKNNIYSGLACRLLKIPMIPNVTGLGPAFDAKGLGGQCMRWLYRASFRKVDRVFFQNTSDRDIFLGSRIVPMEKARLLPGSGVDLDRFADTPLPDEGPGIRFLMVARLLQEKGVGIYAEAARMLRQKHPRAQFQLLGPLDADSRSGISRREIDEWCREGLIEYLGSTQDVLPHLQGAHCVVLPSYYREGTPRSLLEAGAVGRPIITTDIPGCRDVVKNGINGFVTEPRDAGDLAMAMERFLDATPQTRANMGRASRSHMVKNYDESIVIDNYLALLE